MPSEHPRGSQLRMGLPPSQETHPGCWDASPRTRFRGPSLETAPFQSSLGRGAASIPFFRTLPTLPLAGSGQSPPKESARRTKDELASSVAAHGSQG